MRDPRHHAGLVLCASVLAYACATSRPLTLDSVASFPDYIEQLEVHPKSPSHLFIEQPRLGFLILRKDSGLEVVVSTNCPDSFPNQHDRILAILREHEIEPAGYIISGHGRCGPGIIFKTIDISLLLELLNEGSPTKEADYRVE